jgi:hypothetical protein
MRRRSFVKAAEPDTLQAKARRACRRRREIDESIISGRKTGAAMELLYNVNTPTVSRIVAACLSMQF